MQDNCAYKTFDKLVKIIIDLKNRLYERVIKNIIINQKIEQFIYDAIAQYIKVKKLILYIRNSEYTELASINLK